MPRRKPPRRSGKCRGARTQETITFQLFGEGRCREHSQSTTKRAAFFGLYFRPYASSRLVVFLRGGLGLWLWAYLHQGISKSTAEFAKHRRIDGPDNLYYGQFLGLGGNQSEAPELLPIHPEVNSRAFVLLLYVQNVGPFGRSKLGPKRVHIGLGVLSLLVECEGLYVDALQPLDHLLDLRLVALGLVAGEELGGHLEHRSLQAQIHLFDGLGG